jgi:hypothetical protein
MVCPILQDKEYGDRRHAKKNHVTVNGLVAKPQGGFYKITFRKDQITKYYCTDIPESRVGAQTS